MRRFHSNLSQVHDLCRQQRRMAELEFARVGSLLAEARNQEQLAIAAAEQARQSIPAGLRRGITIGSLQTARMNLQRAEEKSSACRKVTQQAEAAWEIERDKCREITSREERLAELISRQKQEYRREVFRQQQVVMDENAAARGVRSVEVNSEVNSHA